MRPLPLRSAICEFWCLIRVGMSPGDAGVAIGVSQRAGHRWFAAVGGVKPRFASPGPRQRPRLSLEEREEIALGIATGELDEFDRGSIGARSIDDLARDQKQQQGGAG